MIDMKESEIPFTGKIPQNWNVIKNKHCFKLEKEIVGDKSQNTELLSLTKQGIVKKDINVLGGKVPESYDTYQKVRKSQIVLCLFDLDCSAVFSDVSKYDGMISPAYKVYNCNKNINERYAKYWFDFCFDGRKYMTFSKSLRYVVNTEDFGEIGMLVPPMENQKKIVAFLDSQIFEIEKVIKKTKETINDYKRYKENIINEAVSKGINKNVLMKDSGIEYIGKIPCDWNIVKIKNIFKIVSGSTPQSDNKDFWDGNINWVTPADFKTENKYVSKGKRNITELGFKSCSTEIIPPFSLIFSKRAPVGEVVINKEELCTNQGCLSCINNKNINMEYFYYLLSVNKRQFELYSSGTTFLEISLRNFSDFKIQFPDIDSQNSIVIYLNKKIEKINKLIKEKENIIINLEQYKKSLIYEYVTGKKELI